MTDIEIINSAMVKLGAKTVLAITDDTVEARISKIRLRPIVDVVLRLHPWSCCRKRAILSALTAAPVFGYTYTLPLPSDYLRLVSIDLTDYHIEGEKLLLADDNRAELIYVARPTDLNTLDPLCAETAAWYLAWDACYAITQSSDRSAACWNGFARALKSARFVSSAENPAGQVDGDVLTEEHHG